MHFLRITRRATIVPAFAILLGAFLAPSAIAEGARKFSGTYAEGHNVTEPRPSSSRYLETIEGGVVVLGSKAGFYLFVRAKEQPPAALYMRIEYQDPKGGPPAWNDMTFDPGATAFNFSSPDFVAGMKIYSDYEITVYLFESKDATTPIDTLKQTVRSYVDTTGAKATVMKGLRAK